MADQQVLVKIMGDVADINAKLNDFKGRMEGVISQQKRLGSESKTSWAMVAAGIASVIYATQQIISKTSYFINSYMEAESATMKLAVAMRNQGDYTKEAFDDLVSYAEQLQKTTAFEDDQIKAMMGNLKTYGMTNEEVKKATKTVLDFATAKRDEGMSVESASELIGKAYQGQTERLKRYGIVIDQSIPKAQQFDAVITLLNDRFGGAAAADLETYAGQWKQIKNEFQDIAEVIGLVLLKSIEAVNFVLSMTSVAFWTMVEAVNNSLAWLAEKLGKIDFVPGFKDNAKNMKALAAHLRETGKEYAGIKSEALRMANANYTALTSFDNVDKAVSKMKPGKRTLAPVDPEIGKAQDEWAKTLRDLQADINKVDLSPLDQKLIEITKKAADLMAGIPKKLPAAEKTKAKEAINLWETSQTQDAIKQEQKKIAEDQFKERSELNNRLVALSQQLTESESSESQKRVIAAEASAEKQRITAIEAYDEGLIGFETYKENIARIETARDKEIEKINAESLKTIRESEINDRLYALDLAEKEGTFHRDTINERVTLMKELLDVQEKYLQSLDKAKDPAGWYAQKNAIDKTKESLIGLKEEQAPVTAALRSYADEATDVWKNVATATKSILGEMTDSLVDFCMTGKANITDLVNYIIKELLKIAIQKYFTGSLSSGLSSAIGLVTSLLGSVSGGSAGASSPGYESAASGVSAVSYAPFTMNALGNIFSRGLLQEFAGSGVVVNRPTFFPMANGAGLMGEAGPEGIMPLKRNSRGQLGVIAEGSGGFTVRIDQTFHGPTSKALITDMKNAMEETAINVLKRHS